uniref:Chemokine interleukin-8-like domain-containing protein n=1 Tax=Oryzias latipes TaxID=8090 RepID=A0A3P9H6A1_ORYLA
MRTLSVTVGLLLLLAALSSNAGRESCCFNFFGQQIPAAFVLSIQKTHFRCHTKAFVCVCVLLRVTTTVWGLMRSINVFFVASLQDQNFHWGGLCEAD